MSKRLFVSFSGGETSGFMAWAALNTEWRDRYDEVQVLFANTGQEREETLVFVDKCDAAFGLGVVYVEAEVYPYERRSPGGKKVDFETASRDGQPFEACIQKYGIPNTKFPACTRDLKLNPMRNYLESIGWEKGTYDTAIGIRADEIDRISSLAKQHRIVYPLISWLPTTKPQINTWWGRQSFRLGLKGYQGNCKWCWKKSFRKHLTLIAENPEIYEFPRRMEREYGHIGPEFNKPEKDLAEGYRRTFFRGNMSVEDLFRMYEEQRDTFEPAEDDSQVYREFDPKLDMAGGCEESCEIFSEEDLLS